MVRELGLDCQLIRNRGELMILPAGVTKGSGLLEALGELGLSPHNAIGVGDAENDHSLLDACEVGVAVANAVDALRAHADMCLALPDGQGVTDLLLGPLLAGRAHLYPRRWQVMLGTDDGGEPVMLPGSQLNIALCGGTGKGKSYLAGLVCEQLIRLGYSLVVFDPEGDHHGLGELPDVITTGGHEGRLAEPAEVVRLLRHGRTSVVIDLSHLGADARAAYATGLASAIEAHRAATGVPQWVVVYEAHVPIGRDVTARRTPDPPGKGYLLVTWQPAELSADALLALDAVITLGSPRPESRFIDITAAVADMPRAEIARLLTGPGGRAVLAWRQRPGRAVAFTLGPRTTPHLRHAHKYEQAASSPPAGSTSATACRIRPPARLRPTWTTWKPSSAAATGACCATTAPAMSSPAGWRASSATRGSLPTWPSWKPVLRADSMSAVVDRSAWRSSPTPDRAS